MEHLLQDYAFRWICQVGRNNRVVLFLQAKRKTRTTPRPEQSVRAWASSRVARGGGGGVQSGPCVVKTARIGCEGPRSVATPQQCQREIGRHRANVRRVQGGVTGGAMVDEEGALRLLAGIFVQAAKDALAGDVGAARWLALNDIPPSSWRFVAKVTATPKKTYRPHRAAA